MFQFYVFAILHVTGKQYFMYTTCNNAGIQKRGHDKCKYIRTVAEVLNFRVSMFFRCVVCKLIDLSKNLITQEIKHKIHKPDTESLFKLFVKISLNIIKIFKMFVSHLFTKSFVIVFMVTTGIFWHPPPSPKQCHI